MNFLNALTAERCFSCKRKPKRYSQRVDVGADIERRVFKLFRAGECRSTNKSVMGQRLQIGLSVNCFSQPEVDYFYGREGVASRSYHLDVVRVQEHQICRLQVSMDQSAFFRSGQCRGHLLRNGNGGTRIERPGAANAFIKRLALD